MDKLIPPTVCVLLTYHHGAAHLAQQLQSLKAQTFPIDTLLIGDDSSLGDLSLTAVLADINLAPMMVRVLSGPHQGAAANFMSLVAQTPAARYYAFCDQDDSWLPEKLARAVAWLDSIPADRPALYGSATRYITDGGAFLGISAPMPRPPEFANALVQCMAGGNTMVFNAAALNLLKRIGAPAGQASHDWLLYALVSGCGGALHYDANPTVYYRQHGANLRGENRSVAARVQRAAGLFNGIFRARLCAQVAALQLGSDMLSPKAQHQLAFFVQALKDPSPWGRLRALRASGAWRQSITEQAALTLAVLMGRL